jgi:hypothetical protein
MSSTWDWTEFSATTRQGRRIEGAIHKVHGATVQAGMLQLRSLDGEPCSLRLYGMPEIPYYDQVHVHLDGAVSVTASRKLDGTAIIFNPIFLRGKYVETICRTRGVPVLANMSVPRWATDMPGPAGVVARSRYKQWVDLVDRVADYGAIENLCKTQRATLVFELYGADNGHCVDYDEALALRLHTMLLGKRMLPRQTVEAHARRWGLEMVELLSPVNGGEFAMMWDKLASQIEDLAAALEQCNDPRSGVFCEEGAVISVNRHRSASLYKVKPPSMAEYYRVTGQPTPITIRHELHKLAEMGLGVEYDTAMEHLKDTLGSGEDDKDEDALFEREYWLWYGATC